MNSSLLIALLIFLSIVRPAFGLAVLAFMLIHFGLQLRQVRLNPSLRTAKLEAK